MTEHWGYDMVVRAFDESDVANSFLSEDGEDGFAGGVSRMAQQITSLRSQLETLKEALARAGTMMVAAAHDVEFHGFEKLATQMREEADEARAALNTPEKAHSASVAAEEASEATDAAEDQSPAS